MTQAWQTPFTDLVGCRVPVQAAVMGGGVSTPELALAVCAAGGLGMLSNSAPRPLPDQLAQVSAGTQTPFGVGFFAWELADREALARAAAAARVVDVFWGEPDAAAIEVIHAGGALACWQVGSRDEALAAVDAGADLVAAQGVEAGGHVRGTTPLLDLLDQVVGAVAVPVIAAGGITTGAAMAAALRAGAGAVRVGTRLVATEESGAHPDYVAALLGAAGEDTEVTTAFGVGWPDAPHRVLRSCVERAAAYDGEVVGQGRLGGAPWDIPRWSPVPPLRDTTGQVGAMPMYAGAGVGAVTDVVPAATVIDRLVGEARSLLPG